MARILIVDDDPDITAALRTVLEAEGHRVFEKADTRDLPATVAEIDPDLIILDVIFPGDPQAGFKAARALRQEPGLAAIPILMLSAVNALSDLAFDFTEEDISDDFLPVEAFLDKPVEPGRLVERVEQLLAGAGRP